MGAGIPVTNGVKEAGGLRPPASFGITTPSSLQASRSKPMTGGEGVRRESAGWRPPYGR